jgi:hypothetical protein
VDFGLGDGTVYGTKPALPLGVDSVDDFVDLLCAGDITEDGQP